MELLHSVIHDLWEGLAQYDVPILNISFKTFLIGTFLLVLLIELLKVFLGWSQHNGKD